MNRRGFMGLISVGVAAAGAVELWEPRTVKPIRMEGWQEWRVFSLVYGRRLAG